MRLDACREWSLLIWNNAYASRVGGRFERSQGGFPSRVAERPHPIAVSVQVALLREAQGLTQAELSALAGLRQADISRIERGATSPTTRALQRIASALNAELRLVSRQ